MTTNELREAAQRLRSGDWNLRAPQEMADLIADMLERIALTATTNEAAAQPITTVMGLPVYEAAAQAAFDVDELAQEIRRVDGTHSLGAGALAEKLVEWIVVRAQPAQGEPFAWYRTVNGVKAGISFDQVHPDIDGWVEHPLYTHPAPAVDRGLSEALRSVLDEMDINEGHCGIETYDNARRALAASAPSQEAPQ